MTNNGTPESWKSGGSPIRDCALARRRNKAAFDRLSSRYRSLLLAMAFVRTGDREAAQDIVQTVLARAWEKIPSLRDENAFLPWIKSITARECMTWSRRRDLEGDSLDCLENIGSGNLATPMTYALARDRQRRLHNAINALPPSNRLALLMHVWSDMPYAEIAAQTGVPTSTVEGRIYRAKQQLRKALPDITDDLTYPAAAGFISTAISEIYESEWSTFMSNTVTPISPRPSDPQALGRLTIRLAALIGSSVPLTEALRALTDSPPPYDQVTRELAAAVELGVPLSEAMSANSELFTPIYTAVVRAGEVGGVLEEAFDRLAQAVMRELRLLRRAGQQGMASLLFLSDHSASKTWDQLSDEQRCVILALFFDLFGMMLHSGVPIMRTMSTIARLLPPDRVNGWNHVIEEIKNGNCIEPPMREMGTFPEFALKAMQVGEQDGTLHTVCYRIANAFEADLDATE